MSLADPEKRELQEELKTRQSEIEALKAELDHLRTENIQIKTEDARIKDENSELRFQLESREREFEEAFSALHAKLLDTLKLYTEQTERLKELEQSAASMIETLNPVHVGQREVELSETLELVRTAGLKLVAKGKDLADAMAKKLPDDEGDSYESAEVKAMIRQFNEYAEAFASLDVPPESPEGFGKCNILEINDELGIVVLSAGYRNGARVNMSLQGGEDGAVQFRIVSLRPFVSGAVVERGDIRKLAVGMEVRVNQLQKEEK